MKSSTKVILEYLGYKIDFYTKDTKEFKKVIREGRYEEAIAMHEMSLLSIQEAYNGLMNVVNELEG